MGAFFFTHCYNINMNLGFIGTGKIASSVITGICNSKISYKKIIISSRNKKIARRFKKKI